MSEVGRDRIEAVVRGELPRSELRDHYEESYHNYAGTPRAFGKPEAYHAPRNRLILAEMQLEPDDRILETGCGAGQVVYMLTCELNCWHVTGIDFSNKAVEWCQGAYPGLTFVRGCVSSMPFAAASFDVVLALDVTEHLLHDTYHAALAEFYRVLVPGGRIAVLPDIQGGAPEHINSLPLAEVLGDLVAVGFTCEERMALGCGWIRGVKL